MQQKIRIGILLNHPDKLQRWQVSCVEILEKNPNVEIVFFASAKCKVKDSIKKSSVCRKIFHQHLFWKLLWKWNKPEQLQEVDFKNDGVEHLELDVKVNNNRFELLQEGLQKLQSLNPDVILRLGWGILKGELLDVPKYGVWSFHHNNPHVFRGGPPAFWEIYHFQKTQGAILQRINHKLDGGQILAESRIRTNLHGFKVSYNSIVNESSALLDKAITNTFVKKSVDGPLVNRKEGVFKSYPNNGQVFSFLWKVIFYKLFFQYRKYLGSENWNTFYIANPVKSINQAKGLAKFSLQNFKAPRKNQFKADPFILPAEQGILFELYQKSTNKAVIAWANLKGDQQKIVLETSHHLSYPYVVNHQGKTYVFPEQKNNEELQVYQWINENKTLVPTFKISIPNCIDPSLVYYNGLWWLFCTHEEHSNSHLYIYHAEQFEGPYEAHCQNPVKMDVSSARPAGQFFIQGNKIFRPTQNNSAFYGAGIQWMEITELSKNQFKEKTIDFWVPSDFGVLGMHHISFNETGIVLDAKTKNSAF